MIVTDEPGSGFTLDEEAARAFLARSLRRLLGAPAGERRDGEDWTLEPGWDLARIFCDGTPHAEHLVRQAQATGALAVPRGCEEIQLVIEAPPGGDWFYEWRVTFPGPAGYALCSPARADFKRLGGFGCPSSGYPSACRGARTAMNILLEAEAAGNAMLRAAGVLFAAGHDDAPADWPAGGILLTRERLSGWAALGRDLTDEELARLARCIPRSSIPDAVATIAIDAMRLTGDEHDL